jgi:putative DNA primase/helicase
MTSREISPALAQLFAELHDQRLFVLYKLVLSTERPGKTDKVPVDPASGARVDAQNIANRMLPAEASLWFQRGAGDGIGILVTEESRLFFHDLDSCREGNGWMPHAANFLSRFPGAYVEVSASGNGLHVLGRYTGPRPRHGTRSSVYHAELYTGSRLCALTGYGAQGSILSDHTAALTTFATQFFPAREAHASAEWTDKPVAAEWHGPEDDDELIAIMRRARRSIKKTLTGGASCADLMDGNPEALARSFPPQNNSNPWDESSADIALANYAAWYTGNNCERMLRIMRRSNLSRAKWDREDYIKGTILKACALIAKGGSFYNDGSGELPERDTSDGKINIGLKGGELGNNSAILTNALIPSVFVRGGSLVRLGHGQEIGRQETDERTGVTWWVDPSGIRRNASQVLCLQASAEWLRLELMRLAHFHKFDARSGRWSDADCPTELATMISKLGSWPGMRPLVSITSVPILRPNMTVCVTPGYDSATGIYYNPTLEVPAIPAHPSRDDAFAALDRLFAPFAQFPYVGAEARAVFLSHLLTDVVRQSVPTSPVFGYTSPVAGTGKTLLADMPGIVARGVEYPSHHTYVEDKDELRKVLFAALLAGDPTLIIDNIPNGHTLRAPVLCNFATSGTFGGRVLGVSKVMDLPNRCTVVLTGNNVTPAGDLARRSLVCRLDANAESGRGRTFTISNLRRHVVEHRAQMIVDVLTVVRAYALAGRPKVAHPLESFEEWSQWVRDPLVWLDKADAVASQATETDDEVGPLRGAFRAIAVATNGKPFTSAQLAAKCMPSDARPETIAAANALRDALLEAGANLEKVGYWLKGIKGRVADGWKLATEGAEHSAAKWIMKAQA